MKFLICISGLTGAGKTTLSFLLFNFLIDPKNLFYFDDSLRINKVDLIHQDDYYWKVDHPNHKFHSGTNTSDRRALTSLNIDKFIVDLESFALDTITNESLNLQILEGTHIYNILKINEHCDFRFHLNISYEVALKRRMNTDRVWSNTTEAYFNSSSWPTYQAQFSRIPNKNDLIYLNGELNATESLDNVLKTIKNKIQFVN